MKQSFLQDTSVPLPLLVWNNPVKCYAAQLQCSDGNVTQCIKSVTQVTQCGSVTVCQCYCAELLCGSVTVQSVTVEAANVTPPAQHNLKW